MGDKWVEWGLGTLSFRTPIDLVDPDTGDNQKSDPPARWQYFRPSDRSVMETGPDGLGSGVLYDASRRIWLPPQPPCNTSMDGGARPRLPLSEAADKMGKLSSEWKVLSQPGPQALHIAPCIHSIRSLGLQNRCRQNYAIKHQTCRPPPSIIFPGSGILPLKATSSPFRAHRPAQGGPSSAGCASLRYAVGNTQRPPAAFY
ncbi:hypothetical protein B9Z19DRAFT_1107119 [Tuber borchii]|uniref:Uncharacterized protein n=1 Tax=Tuber borchii TaxID=42251 RepID=A0A2T6ZXT3_TUBBO|nr:hypothetical protein B9Z19DRAFT_1107119 [Tuber borchii]